MLSLPTSSAAPCSHQPSTPPPSKPIWPGSPSSTRRRQSSSPTGTTLPMQPSHCCVSKPDDVPTIEVYRTSSLSSRLVATSFVSAGPVTTCVSTTTATNASIIPSSETSPCRSKNFP